MGVLAVRTGVRWRSPLPDGAHDPDRVPGFPDVPSVVAAAVALAVVLAVGARLSGQASFLAPA